MQIILDSQNVLHASLTTARLHLAGGQVGYSLFVDGQQGCFLPVKRKSSANNYWPVRSIINRVAPVINHINPLHFNMGPDPFFLLVEFVR